MIRADASDLVEEEHQQFVAAAENSYLSMIALNREEMEVCHLYFGEATSDQNVASVLGGA
jgi:hypothetical protein